MLGHSVDSVRGRISRASLADRVSLTQELANRVHLAQELSEQQPLINAGRERQADIIRRADQVFTERQAQLQERGEMVTAIFVSDLHIPYTDWDAVMLTLQIIKDLQPAYISTYNDLFDFEGYGRWDDTRSPAASLWSDDIANGLAVAAELHEAYRRAAPEALLLQVQGNHDNWMFNHVRTLSRNGFAEHNVAWFMTEIERQGVLQFVNGDDKKENFIALSPGLRWVHGISASANDQAVARATINALSGRDEHDGIFYNTVAGHTHRSHTTSYNGVTHWNSGALCSHTPKYLKHNPRWDSAIVINRYDPNSRLTFGDVVKYRRRGGHLIGRYDGVDYDVPLSNK